MFNITKEDINNSRRQFQEKLMAVYKKSQVWKTKIQSCPEPSKVGHTMYGADNTQYTYLIANVLAVVEKKIEKSK